MAGVFIVSLFKFSLKIIVFVVLNEGNCMNENLNRDFYGNFLVFFAF